MDFDKDPIFFRNQSALREWFMGNYDKTGEAWIGYYKRSTGRESVTWEESVEVAICFGWIDGIRKSIDDSSYKNRFTPRRPGSNWSLKNIATAEKMIREKLMMPAGEEAFKKRKADKSGIYSYEQEKAAFSRDYEKIFRKNRKAWEYFSAEAPHYRKIAIRWVMSARQEKTRIRRLETLILDSENGFRIKPMRPDPSDTGPV
jgi:uncharacterized protein YdeI (YjbR/CyaY-like superfamily)